MLFLSGGAYQPFKSVNNSYVIVYELIYIYIIYCLRAKCTQYIQSMYNFSERKLLNVQHEATCNRIIESPECKHDDKDSKTVGAGKGAKKT